MRVIRSGIAGLACGLALTGRATTREHGFDRLDACRRDV
jgi:hypothetical protein